MVNDPADDAVPLHLPELLDQHLLRDRGDRSLQLRKSEHLSAEQMEEDHQLPPAFENLEGLFDTAGGRSGRVLPALTFWWVPYSFVRSCHLEGFILLSKRVNRSGRSNQGVNAMSLEIPDLLAAYFAAEDRNDTDVLEIR